MPKFHIFIEIDQNGRQTIESRGDPSFWPLVGRLAACHHPQKTTLGPPESKSDIALATLGWSGFGDIQLWAEAVRECALRGEDYLAARAVSEATAAPIRERLQLPESTTPLEVFVALDAELTCKVSEAKGYLGLVNGIDTALRPLVSADEDDTPEEVALLVASRLRSADEQDTAIRAVLEEAIGRTPDPSRSTRQLAHDLAAVLKAAIEAT